ncbi:uncharacterized protein A1O5_12067 [Cladophialophora psammophila CBS 110553]|uniref:Uncharacterized protein n=1 Tax=Cladophialophora psammophila CBS 110553 TaxID=1182543 RepID=W9VUP3_9EURO|nr:uncharacterized protein A1O5_12067 [Cladophialophora psammophila CBS 110553]EXJ59442.1 hypothetical protein A1O5_12067 [Cladophialophora psammophila CBS 110553]
MASTKATSTSNGTKSSCAASLNSAQLKRLLAGPTVTILFRNKTDTDGDDVRVVYEDFPKNVATAFSTKWEAELSPTEGVVGNIKNSTHQTIVVSGADGDTWRKILDWMIRCCQGFGYAQVPNRKLKPYAYQFFIHECAASIGCDILKKRARKRMVLLSVEQIHSEDVRALWLVEPPNEKMRTFLVEHIAIRFWEKRLRAKSAFWTLREEFSDLHDRINLFIAELNGGPADVARGYGPTRLETQGHKKTARNISAVKVEEQSNVQRPTNAKRENKTVTLKPHIVRKATSKTPAYAKLDLASIGVTREKFCGPRY